MRYWLPPFAAYHHSSMCDQLLMWHTTLHIRVYYTQRKVSARLWNARAYGRRSEYIKSVYQWFPTGVPRHPGVPFTVPRGAAG